VSGGSLVNICLQILENPVNYETETQDLTRTYAVSTEYSIVFNGICPGTFRVELRFFERFDRGARVTRVTMPTAQYLATRKIPKIFLRIEVERYHISMTMGMYRIEPPWASICLIQTYRTKYRYWYA
jgi:hypothetical protein